jgi:hypothetical protein
MGAGSTADRLVRSTDAILSTSYLAGVVIASVFALLALARYGYSTVPVQASEWVYVDGYPSLHAAEAMK